MALKIPLVLGPDGNVEQLQTGDTIAGAGSTQLQLIVNTDPMVACVKFNPMVFSGAGDVVPAQADALANARVLGLALTSEAVASPVTLAVMGVVNGTTAEWDVVTGGAGGLTPGALYFLDPATPGAITTTPPTAAGDVVVLLGQALETTDLQLDVQSPILL